MKNEKIYINNCKLVKEIFSNNFNVGKKDSIVVGRNNLRIVYAINPKSKKEVVFSFYDKIVLDGVYTIYENSESAVFNSPTVFSLRELLHAISCKETQSLSDEKKAALEKSVKKLSETEIIIDCKEEYKKRGIDKEGFYCGKLLDLEKTSGKQAKYSLKRAISVFEYAEDLGQIIAVPPKLFMCNKSLSNTEEVIKIKRYLISRLETLRNPNNSVYETNISYCRYGNGAQKFAGLMYDIGIERNDFLSKASWEKKIKKVHKTVTDILNYFVDIKYIYSFKESLDGKKNVIGVEIISDEDNKAYVNDPWKL